ncbi:Single-pass membrane and coiled-coil domain-containing protein 4 like [Pseudolycoriella hygida]|uniref:Single-pass membrane and coiled-coil domain-containing protein 4 homolog n=1 Tax=Pseudolycoriella hygida TaxID=35572 RepID=A0A9Q0RU95_9DIPT|nr:Single-pass membrane and coiled-coil domain-containing protein 4 like [Pseudolycoriella hygida]
MWIPKFKMARQLKGKPTETYKQKKERREENRKIQQQLTTVVLPILGVIVVILVAYVLSINSTTASTKQSRLPKKLVLQEKTAEGSKSNSSIGTMFDATKLPRKSFSKLPTAAGATSRKYSSRTAATTTSSLFARQPKSVQTSITESTKITLPAIRAQSSHQTLTVSERKALHRKILHKNVGDKQKKTAPFTRMYDFKHSHARSAQKMENELMKKQSEVKEKRDAQERIIFPSEERENEEVMMTTHDVNPRSKNAATRYKKCNEKRKVNNKKNEETIQTVETKRQERMESELSADLIEDTNASILLRHSVESDSLDELVIKDFVIRMVESKPDVATTSLPVIEQAIIESKKLKDSLDSIRKRFQVKIATEAVKQREKDESIFLNIVPTTEPYNFADSEEELLNERDIEFDMNEQNSEITNHCKRDNVEDFENPHFSDLPSDVSENVSVSIDKNVAMKKTEDKGDNLLERPNSSQSAQSQQEKDAQKFRELLESGALRSSITTDQFEEGVLDLLLRQSDSLWDPVVPGGIPIAFLIPSKNYQKSLLDTSITEKNLRSPMIKRPEAKTPGSLTSEEEVDFDNVTENFADHRNLLMHELPEFSYEPFPQYCQGQQFRNIIDIDEQKNSDDIIDVHKINFDDLNENVAEPTFDFEKAKILDDLQIKMRIYQRLKGNGETFSKQTPEIRLITYLEAFKHNLKHFNGLFGIDENEIFRENYVTFSDLKSFCHKIPLFDGEIIRDVRNCRHHFELMKSIYKKILKFIQQSEQPQSFQINDGEIFRRFVLVADGRICARLKSCDSQNSLGISRNHTTAAKKYESQLKVKQSSQEQTTRNQLEHQAHIEKPEKIKKSVSFSDNIKQKNIEKIENETFKNTHQQNSRVCDGWTMLDIRQVRDLIEQARSVQAKRRNVSNVRKKA